MDRAVGKRKENAPNNVCTETWPVGCTMPVRYVGSPPEGMRCGYSRGAFNYNAAVLPTKPLALENHHCFQVVMEFFLLFEQRIFEFNLDSIARISRLTVNRLFDSSPQIGSGIPTNKEIMDILRCSEQASK